MQVLFSLDGEPVDEDCACPVCAEIANAGIRRVVAGPDGELRELEAPTPRPMIDVTVRGTPSTWPELPPEPRTVSVPVGCVVHDLLAYVQFKSQPFAIAFATEDLSATIGGVRCEPNRVLQSGDAVIVSGVRDPAHARLMRSILTPLPDGVDLWDEP